MGYIRRVDPVIQSAISTRSGEMSKNRKLGDISGACVEEFDISGKHVEIPAPYRRVEPVRRRLRHIGRDRFGVELQRGIVFK